MGRWQITTAIAHFAAKSELMRRIAKIETSDRRLGPFCRRIRAKQPCNCRLVIATANSHSVCALTRARDACGRCENARAKMTWSLRAIEKTLFLADRRNSGDERARTIAMTTRFFHNSKIVKTLGPQRANKVRFFCRLFRGLA
jgi:hypothetical protein